MSQNVVFTNEKDNRIKTVKVGFSWTLLFWSWLFGLPFFIRRAYSWGALFAFLQGLNYLVGRIWIKRHCFQQYLDYSNFSVSFYDCDYIAPFGFIGFAILVLSIYMGFRGNELTARYYLRNGYKFDAPESSVVKVAKARWHMPVD